MVRYLFFLLDFPSSYLFPGFFIFSLIRLDEKSSQRFRYIIIWSVDSEVKAHLKARFHRIRLSMYLSTSGSETIEPTSSIQSSSL